MPLPSIRRLAAADLTDEIVEALIRHGEDDLVERKRQPPSPPKFGAAAASFANTLGGWVLLGVDDDRTVHGWQPDRRKTDLQSHLANLLRAEVDPLPPFVAVPWVVEGRPIAIVRVFESSDVPHIVRGTGALYVRSSKGKVPVDDYRELLALARRGRDALRDAEARLIGSMLVHRAIMPPDVPREHIARGDDLDRVRFAVRAAPLTMTSHLAGWPISGAGARACQQIAGTLDGSQAASVEPAARGVIAWGVGASGDQPSRGIVRSIVAADSLGVFGASIAESQPLATRGPQQLHEIHRRFMRPAIDAVCLLLGQAEAVGRIAIDGWLMLPGLTIVGEHAVGVIAEDRERDFHVSSELSVPVGEDERAALVCSWEREIGRSVGIARWESDQAPEGSSQSPVG